MKIPPLKMSMMMDKPTLVRRLMGRPGSNKKPMVIYMISGEKYGPVNPFKKEK